MNFYLFVSARKLEREGTLSVIFFIRISNYALYSSGLKQKQHVGETFQVTMSINFSLSVATQFISKQFMTQEKLFTIKNDTFRDANPV